jgi:thiosulfate dehydrogenase
MENQDSRNTGDGKLIQIIQQLIGLVLLLIFALILLSLFAVYQPNIGSWFNDSKIETTTSTTDNNNEALKVQEKSEKSKKMEAEFASFWVPVDIASVIDNKLKEQLEYGKDLIAHTAKYLGPKGSVMQSTNGMNCQNCHLDAGTKPYGNNYGSVFSTYPKYRARSGKEEDIYKRVNDCLERSLNGKALKNESKEMQAIKAYIEFIGKNVPKGEKTKGSGIFDLPLLERPADPKKGKELFAAKCQSCHQSDGKGLLASNNIEYTYPPLWGNNSYNHGAGLYRMSRFAGYIKYNMPQGATYLNPLLSDEESWDIAAFVNSQPRPKKDLSKDWPKMDEKVFDHPFGPYADSFSETQHKYGPFKPIKEELKKQKELKEKLKANNK